MNELAIIEFNADQSIQQAKQINDIVVRMSKEILKADHDYGVIPGTNKPTLYKAGAEKLCSAFGLSPEFVPTTQIEDFDTPLFFYRYTCQLRHITTGKILATGLGSCNSMESKYGFRWMPEHDVPPHHNKPDLHSRIDSIEEFDFAIKKAETSGKYGKPVEYWQKFQDAIEDGTATKFQKSTSSGKSYDAYRITDVTYRVPNDDVFSIVNTIDKMAQKRALIAAVLIGVNASEFFTQDIEDLPEFESRKPPSSTANSADIVDGEFEETTPTGNGEPELSGRQPSKPRQQSAPPSNNGSDNDPNVFQEKARRAKVFNALPRDTFANMTELVDWAKANGIDWTNQSSEEILAVIAEKMNIALEGVS